MTHCHELTGMVESRAPVSMLIVDIWIEEPLDGIDTAKYWRVTLSNRQFQ